MIEEYRRLFVNRDDVFAEQQSSGAYLPVKRPLEDHDITAHLRGEVSYGVYVIEPTGQTVTSVVWDLDTYAADELAFLVTSVENFVDALGVSRECLLLEDSGGKGYHVWLLLSEPTPAVKVRAWLEDAFWPAWDSA